MNRIVYSKLSKIEKALNITGLTIIAGDSEEEVKKKLEKFRLKYPESPGPIVIVAPDVKKGLKDGKVK